MGGDKIIVEYSYAEFIPILKAISDETRLKIIDMLSCEEMCANDILDEFKISQSTLSYHMKILSDAGIVIAVREGAWMRYNLNKDKAEGLINFIEYITSEKDDCICRNVKRGDK